MEFSIINIMNNKLKKLHKYPFEKLRNLLCEEHNISSEKEYYNIDLSIGEPKHDAPACVKEAIIRNLDGISIYPPTQGDIRLRNVISNWLSNRYNIPIIDPETSILPVLGSKEALFSLTQTIINSDKKSIVICPNPCYQIYEGAAILAGSEVYYIPADEDNDFSPNWDKIPIEILNKTQLVFVCSPGNPTGNVITLEEWKKIFDLSDKYGFIIASDECYSEIYKDEKKPVIGSLQAANILGRNYDRLIMFSSLSKRSNLPGLRSGFVAGDKNIIKDFLLYRTYHGSAMNPLISEASIAAWSDEKHVIDNRLMYRNKFNAVVPILKKSIKFKEPDASFYLWLKTPISDEIFTKQLYHKFNVKVIPGRFLSRNFDNYNPGNGYVRIALVAPIEECIEASNRIINYINKFI